MDCIIIKFINDKDGNIIGVILQADNGDTQYLTIEEYNKRKTNGK